jgi:hypothetical protein
MTGTENQKFTIDQAGKDLFNFALDREDVKMLVTSLPKEASCNPAAVEYELQLLKIISTGWSISFFLGRNPVKDQLADEYWKSIHVFAQNLSETTGLMTGHAISYFQIIKDRLHMYVTAMADKPKPVEPAAVIGPVFAEHCGNAEDVFTIMAGSRMFMNTVARVREYFDAASIATAEY